MSIYNKFPIFYKINYLDEERGIINGQGFLFACSYKDAMEQIVEYYGESNINAVTIIMMEEDYILEIEDKELWLKLFDSVGGQDNLFNDKLC